MIEEMVEGYDYVFCFGDEDEVFELNVVCIVWRCVFGWCWWYLVEEWFDDIELCLLFGRKFWVFDEVECWEFDCLFVE